MSFIQDGIIGRWNKLVYETSSQIKKLQNHNQQPAEKPDETLFKRYPLNLNRISSFDEYQSFIEKNKEVLTYRKQAERDLINNKYGLLLKGFCYACGGPALFFTRYKYHPVHIDGERMPNWHEGLVCSGCKMNNRMRGAIHALDKILKPKKEDDIYLTEQTTHMYRWFSNNYKMVVGSEYLGDSVPCGSENEDKIRNEDLRNLSFSSNKFDLIISLSVLEHIPDYLPTLKEGYRCLKPGGTLVLHVPFFPEYKNNLVRATMTPRGEIEHLLPPEYHGDPLNTSGVLCYCHFGWELLQQLRDSGFSNVYASFFWSPHWGYLGKDLAVIFAEKSP